MPNVAYVIQKDVPGGGMGNHAWFEIKALDDAGLLRRVFSVKLRKEVKAEFVPITKHLEYGEKMIMDNLGDIDILHAWSYHAYYNIIEFHKKGKTVIITYADPFDETLLLEERKKFKIPLYRPHEKEIWSRVAGCFKRTDFITTNSWFSGRSFVDRMGIPKDRILVNHLPTENPDKVEDFPDEFQALFLGTASIRKGFYYLMKAFYDIDTKIRIQGGIHEELTNSVSDLISDNMNFHSFDPDVDEIYNSCSVLIQPSIIDGYAMPVIEAMAHGRPVIVTENVGSGELVEDGESGFIVPIRDPDAIREKVQYFVDNPGELKRMGGNARKIAEKCTLERYAKRLVEWYNDRVLG